MNLFDIIFIIILIINIFWILILLKYILKQANIICEAIDYVKDESIQYPSAKEWRNNLIKILEGDEKNE